MAAVCGGQRRARRPGEECAGGDGRPLPLPTMRAPASVLLALALAAAAATGAAAEARCVTYFVATPAAPFSYKAGFTKATWPKVGRDGGRGGRANGGWRRLARRRVPTVGTRHVPTPRFALSFPRTATRRDCGALCGPCGVRGGSSRPWRGCGAGGRPAPPNWGPRAGRFRLPARRAAAANAAAPRRPRLGRLPSPARARRAAGRRPLSADPRADYHPTLPPSPLHSISKLFMQGACVSTRDNNFPSGPPTNCSAAGTAADTSTATCEAVRDSAPAGTWVSATDILASGAEFDSGNVREGERGWEGSEARATTSSHPSLTPPPRRSAPRPPRATFTCSGTPPCAPARPRRAPRFGRRPVRATEGARAGASEGP